MGWVGNMSCLRELKMRKFHREVYKRGSFIFLQTQFEIEGIERE
jgi:hypothetical protein